MLTVSRGNAPTHPNACAEPTRSCFVPENAGRHEEQRQISQYIHVFERVPSPVAGRESLGGPGGERCEDTSTRACAFGSNLGSCN
eukprot:7556489-Lingulodinium_polyedra.AAC.1